MNARNVCFTMLLLSGSVLFASAASAGPAESGLDQVQATIRHEQITDFHRRAMEEFPQPELAASEKGFAATELAAALIAAAEDAIRLQGRLALWSIQEEQLASFRTGRIAQSMAAQQEGVIVAVAESRTDSPIGKAKGLLKSARFEWPEFLPAMLR